MSSTPAAVRNLLSSRSLAPHCHRYMAFMVGTLLVYNTAYRCTEMAFQGNHPMIVLLAVSNLAAACFAFYVGVAAPAMDPVASLSSFITESSVLVLQTTLLLALIECVKRVKRVKK